jgi:hypothetical protein
MGNDRLVLSAATAVLESDGQNRVASWLPDLDEAIEFR